MVTGRNLVVSLALLILLAGCGGQAYNYTDSNEQKPGPGLLSGEDGVFNLYGNGAENGADVDGKNGS